MSWLEEILSAPFDPAPCGSLTDWWPRQLVLCRSHPATIAQAIVCGFHADRLGWAFVSAYSAALRLLVPGIPLESSVAICVTEAEGNAPRAIRSELRRVDGAYFLDGAKCWTTLGPGVQLLLVAARDAEVQGDRPLLRLARVPADTPGVHVAPMPPAPFIPEIPHARLRFENVRVPEGDVLPGDGYARFVKPFRTVEDVHVQAALLAYLVRESRRLAWPRAWTERAVAWLVALDSLASLDPLGSWTHLALAGALAGVAELVAQADGHWGSTPDDPAALRWIRDRRLLGVAAAQREKRTQAAWARLGR